MLFYFCILVYNGAGHILLLDFLWAHPNSLYWPIKSSGPNNVCNVWYIWIYMSVNEGFFFLGWKNGTHCTLVLRAHMDWILGMIIPSQIEHILGHQWSTKMTFHGINHGKHFIYCHLMHALMYTYDPMSFKISLLFSWKWGYKTFGWQCIW